MPISSERYRNILERPDALGTLTAEDIRRALNRSQFHDAFEVSLGGENGADITAALQNLAIQANEYGLDVEDIKRALPEVVEQLQLEANAVARHEHDDKRSKTKFYNIPKQIGLRWQEMLETFGAGKIAERAKQYRSDRAHEVGYMEEVITAALERTSIRKRFDKYLDLGGQPLRAAVESFNHGTNENGRLLSTKDFFDNALAQRGIENIMDRIDIPDPFITGYDPETGQPIEMPLTAETEAIIRNHLKFILRDELAHLVQMSQMQVMTTEQYQVESKKGSVMIGKVLGSGTFWGAVTRTGAKLAIGGSLVGAGFAAVPVGGAVLAAAGIGAVAGAASQVAQYYGARRKQRKMDLAIGAQAATVELEGDRQIEVAKSAESINIALATHVQALESAVAEYSTSFNGDFSAVLEEIGNVYKVITDTEFRLLQTRLGKEKQDYINFGLDNRLAAQTELLKNIRNANHAMHEAMALFTDSDHIQSRFIAQFAVIATEAQRDIQRLEQNLGSVLRRGETTRVIAGAVLGGGFAGLSSMAMGYIDQWFSAKSIDVKQIPTFNDKKSLEIVRQSETLTIRPGDKSLTIADSHGNSRSIDLPGGIKPDQVVIDDNLQLYEAATGKQFGALEVDLVTAATADLKTPSLQTTLSPDHHQLITVGDKQFGLIVERDGTMTIHGANADGSVDISRPLNQTPINVFYEDIHTHIAELSDVADKVEFAEKAAQFNVTSTPEGVVTVKSVYDESVVAQFKLSSEVKTPTSQVDAGIPSTTTGAALSESALKAGSAAVPEAVPATPAQAPKLLEQILKNTDSQVSKLLNTMGVKADEIKVSSDGTFTIANDAVKGEYLGQVDGWRQHRLELLLQAYQEKRIAPGESAEVVLARLERATRHLVNEHDKYSSAQAALKEAFGRKADFIQSKEVPYIDDSFKEKGFAGVRTDWQKIIEELHKQTPSEPSTSTAPGVGTPHPIESSVSATGSSHVAEASSVPARPAPAPEVISLIKGVELQPLTLADVQEVYTELGKIGFNDLVATEDTGMEGYDDLIQTIGGTLAGLPPAGLQQLAETYLRMVGGDTHLLGRELRKQLEKGTVVAPFAHLETPTEEVKQKNSDPDEDEDNESSEFKENRLHALEGLENDSLWGELGCMLDDLREGWEEGLLTDDVHEQEQSFRDMLQNLSRNIFAVGDRYFSDYSRERTDETERMQKLVNNYIDNYEEPFITAVFTRDKTIYQELEVEVRKNDFLPENVEEINGQNNILAELKSRFLLLKMNTNLLPDNEERREFLWGIHFYINKINDHCEKLMNKRAEISASLQVDDESVTEMTSGPTSEPTSSPVNLEEA